MKRPACSLALLMLAVPQLLFAQAAPEPPLVTVTGSAELKVKPDIAELSVGVQATSPKLETAKAEHDTKMRAALEALKQLGVPEADVATSYLRIEPETNRAEPHAKPELTYSVRQELDVRLHDVAKAEAVLTALLKAGINVVEGVNYQTSELRKHRDTARQMAVKAAREKAEALATELGAKRGKVYRIREIPSTATSVRNTNLQIQNAGDNEPAEVEAGGTLSAGQISISASIEVAFLIE